LGDDISLAGLVGLLVALLLLSAFFSGSETALMSLNRYQLRHKAREGHRGAQLAERLLRRPDRVIGLILLGNNLVNFSAASLVAIIALKIGGQPAVALGTLILTLLVLVFSEAAPKTWAALHPQRLAFPAAIIYYPLLKITYPLVWLINVASNGVLWLIGVRGGESSLDSLTREELRTIVHEAGVGWRVVRIEPDCSLNGGLGVIVAVKLEMQHPVGGVHLAEGRINTERPLQRTFRRLLHLAPRHIAVPVA